METAPVTYGTKETKDVLVLAFKLGGAVKASMADGKFDFNDAGNFFPVIPSVGPAFENIGLIPKEMGDLTEAEALDLEATISQEVGELISKEKLVLQINSGLKLVHAMYEFYLTLK
jgi:hypothetical protein